MTTATTVYARFRETALRRGEAGFLNVLPETADIYGIAAEEISYGAMLERVERWRAAFASRGYGAGHRVGLLLQNRPVFIELWFALNALGVSVVPINPDLRVSELEYIIAHSEMNAAFVLAKRREEVETAARQAGRPIPVVTDDGDVPAPFGGARPANAGDGASQCALLYTSGTTGQPKGCVLTNTYFLYSGDWYRDVGGLIDLGRDGERMITPLPLFHMNAMAVSVMAMLSVGGSLTMLDRFHPRSWWQSVRDSRATCLHYLGVMPSMLMSAPPSNEDRAHTVRFGFGAGVDKLLHAPFEERFGFPLLEAWAMTETGSGGVIAANAEPRKVGTSCFGRPAPEVEVRIVDDGDNDAAVGAPGELLVRRAGADPRYGFFREYLKNPEATAEAWQGGWLHTGDIVSRDADGDLHFVDRKKNVIRRSGENIAAVEVESVLNRLPAIRQAAVAATPDQVRGDEVAAVIIAEQPGADRALAEEIVRWSLEQMAYYKAPGWICFVEELPLTATEKIQRGGLKDVVAKLMREGAFFDLRDLKRRQE
ncbi:ATP-dependent acyl-CoA ligase [Bradyrhizobium viridifuturi]|nr:ATP-dependent acyl-CoA ligase [Bradyrhizobium viridifuturi]ERF84764.1 MAG: crotonobetaine/carnitine-CoA ligase [Bradyrhizobium sp. DFCI-1]QRI72082.1 ATP-dependent acyl-CoA ligase [Bradyrhizobium sp. PSBB068]MBR1021900.1 ATP-dependent acyl-CoA ligase [Bradyrhizobium viridifuturi]MBR1039419.1 ATP-dependent acyl-CoA ligase [Bradyrhizobium viridifuturi]MBR1046114.1 ATP-dependent acyl-CoA ligase [Bradyrhizobium viridifuturi]